MPGAAKIDEVKSLCVCVRARVHAYACMHLLYEWLNLRLYSVKICRDMKVIFKQVLIPVY